MTLCVPGSSILAQAYLAQSDKKGPDRSGPFIFRAFRFSRYAFLNAASHMIWLFSSLMTSSMTSFSFTIFLISMK